LEIIQGPHLEKDPAELLLRRVRFFSGSAPDQKPDSCNCKRSRRNHDHPLSVLVFIQFSHLRSPRRIAAGSEL